MKKLVAFILASALMGFGVVSADAAKPTTTTYTFTVMDTEGGKSNVTGNVTLRALPNGWTLVQIRAKGLQTSGRYFLTYSTNTSCVMETDSDAKTFEHFTSKNGNLVHTERINTDLSNIGSIGLRTETGQTLVACASTP